MGSRLVTASTISAALTALVLIAGSAAASSLRPPTEANRIVFTANRGQWDSSIVFRAGIGADATVWFAENGAFYQLSRVVSGEQRNDPLDSNHGRSENLMIRATFVGAKTDAEIIGEGQLNYDCNYFLGNDASRWRTHVPNFEAVLYRDIYSGIDLRYYANGSQLEYDFVVAPGADPGQIRIKYEGVENLRVNDSGELEIETGWGKLTERIPYVYQTVDGQRKQLDGAYELQSDNTFGFVLTGNYDPELPTVIDPVIVYSSFFGGGAYDYAWDIFVTETGEAYFTGVTNSQDFPTQFPLQEEIVGQLDFVLAKVDLETNIMIFGTFIGGALDEARPHIDVDDHGTVYMCGRTYSADFPTVNAYDDVMDGTNDGVVMKISSIGDMLLYSTFLGGNDQELATDIAVDEEGHAFVSTITFSQDFPVVNPYQVTPSQGTKDCTVSKFTPMGDALIYSTYLGGVQDEESRGIAIDQSGCVYIAGKTYSRDFPVANAWDSLLESGEDVFLAKLNPEGNDLVFGTFMGGADDDYAGGIALDRNGDIYLVGGTESADFPTQNAYQPVFMGGGDYVGNDMFVAKFSGDGSELLYSTFLGGTHDDHWGGVAVDRYGHVYIVGNTYSIDFPLVDPVDDIFAHETEAVVARLSPDGSQLEFSSFLGGNSTETAQAVRLDEMRNIYIVGDTRSPDFPVVDPSVSEFAGGRDFFVTKIEIGCCDGLRGNFDYDDDDLVSPVDVVAMVDWLYAGADDPTCFEEADFNGDGLVDAQDLILLVEFLWITGVPSAECYIEQ